MLEGRVRGPGRTRLLTSAEGRLAVLLPLTMAALIAMSAQIQLPATQHLAALFAHLIASLAGFGSVLPVDWFGSLWLLRRVSMETLLLQAHRMQPPIWLGTLGLCLTGALLIPDLHSPPPRPR